MHNNEYIRIKLDPREFAALVRVAEQELRPLAQQAQYIIRNDLERRGVFGGDRDGTDR